MADGYALIGHVFQNISVAGVLNCHMECQPNCRCISFNFLTNVKEKNCQLNEENRHLKPGALKPVRGSQYYDVVIEYRVKVRRVSWARDGGIGGIGGGPQVGEVERTPYHCQKSRTKQPRVPNTVKMAANSYKKMYEESKIFANVAVVSSRVFTARLEL